MEVSPVQELVEMITSPETTIETQITGDLPSAIPCAEVVEQKIIAESETNVQMVGKVRVINLDKAKSLLKKELFSWLDTDFIHKRIGIQTLQVNFTKCGRFAVLLGRSKTAKSFGLRLATLDAHHQLRTYLLGVSFSLESSLLHMAARIKQLEGDMDEIDATVKHGDVVMVDHLGYSHCAVYDAEHQVFYELTGDIDSGKDAFLSEINSMSSKALEFHQRLTEATRGTLGSAMNLLSKTKKPSNLQLAGDAVVNSPAIKITDDNGIDAPIPTKMNANGMIPNITTEYSVPTPEPILDLSEYDPSGSSSPLSELAGKSGYPSSLSGSWMSNTTSLNSSVPSSLHSSQSATPEELQNYEESKPELNSNVVMTRPTYIPPGQFDSPSPVSVANPNEASTPYQPMGLLAKSGHSLRIEDFPAETDESEDDDYDMNAYLRVTHGMIRNLAQSNEDIGLRRLLSEEDGDQFTPAGTDAQITLDDMCPAMAYGFPSHSIAEVQATPKDIFLSRDPLLKKRIKSYANALPADLVIARARSAVSSPGWNPVTRNCEHFTTWAKTGKTTSTQVFEFSSGAAILGAGSLQAFITFAFFGMITLWMIGLFTSGNYIVEALEATFTIVLKVGVLASSIIFALGILVHWSNGRSADFDGWTIERAFERRLSPEEPTAMEKIEGAVLGQLKG